jgi:hypothetical protein
MIFNKKNLPWWYPFSSNKSNDDEASFSARCDVPPESAADDIAFAVLEKLLQKDLSQNMQDLRAQLERRRQALDYLSFPEVIMGVMMAPNFVFKSFWMRGEIEPEKAIVIKGAFEGFMNKVEWEDE